MGYQNFFATKLFTDIGAGDTTITLETPPIPTSGRLVLEARNPTQREIIKYTGVSGNQITGVIRGQGGTSAKTHTKNSLVEMNATGEDLQDVIDAFASFAASANDWRTSLNLPLTVTHLGQRSYQLTYGSSILSYKSVGMRNRYTHAAQQTQCADFESTVPNYANRAAGSVAGWAITTQITVEAWVKPESYATYGTVLGRFLTNAGFLFRYNSDTYRFQILAGTGGAFDEVNMKVASPKIGRWSHIAMTMDIGAATGTAYINGIPVAITYVNSAATSIAATGGIAIGVRHDTNSDAFDGLLSDVRVWNTIRTQSQIAANMHNKLVGNETGLIGNWLLDGNFNDATGNANHLTPAGATVATTADAPRGLDHDNLVSSTVDYSITTDISADGLTEIVQVPEGCGIPTNTAITALAYSGAKSPHLFPTDEERWTYYPLWMAREYVSGMVANTWWGGGENWAYLPVGSWDIEVALTQYSDAGGSQSINHYATFSNNGSTEDDKREFIKMSNSNGYNGNSYKTETIMMSGKKRITALTQYYLMGQCSFVGNHRFQSGSNIPSYVRIKLGYL